MKNQIINLEDFRCQMKHNDSFNKTTHQKQAGELLDFFAYKIDEKDGLSEFLGFQNGEISQSDYFLIDEKQENVQFIELTDLSEGIKECIISEKILSDDIDGFSQALNRQPKKAQKIVKHKIWSEVVGEFKNKWMGSMAVLERYCRKQNIHNNLNYTLLIVLTNESDLRQINSLMLKLKGMMGNVKVCNSKNIENCLLCKIL